MKVLMCATQYPPGIWGGAEISTALIARGLVDRGVDLRVLTFTDDAYSQEHYEGVEVIRIPCPNIYWSVNREKAGPAKKVIWHCDQALRWRPPTAIRQEILAIGPDLIHSSTILDFGASLWRWAAEQKVKTIHTIRDHSQMHRGSTMYDPVNDRQLNRDLLSWPKSHYSHYVDGIVGVSKSILHKHQAAGFFASAVPTVIGNPIDAEIAEIPATNVGPIKIGVLGRVSPEKGIMQFMESLSHVSDEIPWQLSIAGNGPDKYVQQLKANAEGLPVEFLAWTNSREFLKTLDLLVVPSRCEESFGRTVVEAYSIGLPVLCLGRGALPELVKEGITGWLCEDWTTQIIGNALCQCRHLDRTPIRHEAKQFTVKSIAQQYEQFYQRVLAR